MMEPTRLRVAVPVETGPAFEDFFLAEHERLFQALYLLTGDIHEADDVAQEALVRAYERWDRVGSMDSPTGYVYRIALNLYRSRLRKAAVRARRVFASVPVDDASGQVTTRHEVHRALRAIPAAQREALVLTEWLGLTSDEAGQVLGVEAASVRGRVHRARASLRDVLEDTTHD